MTSVQQPISNSTYSYTSIRYYCTNCQRPFSELSTGDSSSQARCPRCNLWAYPASSQNNTQNTQSSRSSNTNNQPSQPRPSRPQAASASRPQINQPDPFGFFTQQMGNPFGNGFFDGFGVPAGYQNQERPRANNHYNSNTQSRSNNGGQYWGNNGGNVFSQVFGDFGNMFGNPVAAPQNFGFADGFGGYGNVFNGFNGYNQPANAYGGANTGNMGNVYNDFGPYMADDATIEEFLRDDPNEYGPPPAPEKAIKKLSEVRFDPARKEEGSENLCCPVCQEDYHEGETLVRLPCNHDYHRQCVEPWLNKHNSCPMCRNPI